MDDSRDAISRRRFLSAAGFTMAAGALGGHGLARASSQPPAPMPLPGKPITPPVRLAVVGGNFGAQFFWHQHPQCKVVAVSDLLPQRRDFLKKTYQCDKAYDSLDALLADPNLQLDAVALFTDAPSLPAHCEQCLNRGLHVAAASPAALTLPDARRLRDAVARTGLTYFMAETSYYHQSVISARNWYKQGLFGNIFSCDAEYHHPGLEELFVDEAGNRTWRYGLPPMLYSTHCTGQLMGVTGERLTQVTCHGWGDDSPILKDNLFRNPFWGETALFKTDKGNSLRAQVYWRGALGTAERAQWLGEKMSFWAPHPNGSGPIIRRLPGAQQNGKPLPPYEKYDQQLWWETDLLPEPLRQISGHDGSHTFLTHEFIQCLVEGLAPSIPVGLALDMAIPGIIAHQSALQGGKTLSIPSAADL